MSSVRKTLQYMIDKYKLVGEFIKNRNKKELFDRKVLIKFLFKNK